MEKKGLKISLAVLVAVIFVSFFVFILPALANGAGCTAPDGYQVVTNRIGYDLTGSPVFILRAVVATGEGGSGGKAINLPSCGSSDPDIEEVGNVYVVLDGRQILILTGSVGRDTSQ
ncbi:MAG: hypothetical protein ACD_13C00052G0034 [uncultured bacterium]|uniref:Uncharacterized protein n=1 Tax=Candidatus Woesebacteria bacterium GW2011_GWA1_40_43 TaxID=1618553 RepID=A0A0G0UUC7_9BACT|nr:MAG: hypothetical protein ACD_13C00052G0034 [uncultured bacterium]KKR54288.1 MAG: hypothetical protein UT88_C0001G0041 [Candidatus Woesebacteria bacterium GW2011_GWD2_40_19]KKR56695.1 MAG: hypothetical protein UT96_C0036G0003 [Candidatus Woesebacteria bacterium GW2011_GWC2_40_30]KKR63275.1 MAG: hypothetical protein UU02_C0028G0017 [Candidatus Woesebacteria bacterium GW2011_GWA1_40_43]HAU65594.1 hypothetical protein [Candidatus Woesebacteria bacterium]